MEPQGAPYRSSCSFSHAFTDLTPNPKPTTNLFGVFQHCPCCIDLVLRLRDGIATASVLSLHPGVGACRTRQGVLRLVVEKQPLP